MTPGTIGKEEASDDDLQSPSPISLSEMIFSNDMMLELETGHKGKPLQCRQSGDAGREAYNHVSRSLLSLNETDQTGRRNGLAQVATDDLQESLLCAGRVSCYYACTRRRQGQAGAIIHRRKQKDICTR